jgi:hypothetical protein
LEASEKRCREEVLRRETAEANARELLALWQAQNNVTESHNLAVKDAQNKAKFCYAAVKNSLSSEQRRKKSSTRSRTTRMTRRRW